MTWTRRHAAALVPLVAASLLAGCAGAGPKGFVCPAKGGPPWRELRSPGFVVKTDLPEAEARTLVAQLERQRAVISQASRLGDQATAGRLEVVAFATLREFRDWGMTPNQVGFFYRDGYGRQRVVLGGGLDDELRRILAHELAHFLSAHATIRQPRWYSEGWAQYLETVSRSERSPKAGLPPQAYPEYLERGLLPARSVLTWRSTELVELQAYASSWLLVHYLVDRKPRELEAFRQRLAKAQDPAEAWNATFPAWSLLSPGGPEALDVELKAYLRRDSFPAVTIEVAAVDLPVEVRPLDAGDVQGLRIQLARVVRRHRLRAEVDEALAEDPGHVEALRDEAMRTKGSTAAIGRRAVAAHPEDHRAWVLLAEGLRAPGEAAEREAAYRKAVALAPEDSEAHAALALDLIRSSHRPEAIAESRRAVALAPWSPRANLVLAAALAADGQCPEAIGSGQRAVEMLADSSPADATVVAQEVAALQDACAAGR